MSTIEGEKNLKRKFPGIPDPDFYPDSIFSGFFDFFESVASI